mmetsp:Transcript_27349/g.61774  ORF Transcript_27349/g.61774 Transcript_27349/m.61774 type:complete len:283 (+) Transcript_27349:1997-2845(+)
MHAVQSLTDGTQQIHHFLLSDSFGTDLEALLQRRALQQIHNLKQDVSHCSKSVQCHQASRGRRVADHGARGGPSQIGEPDPPPPRRRRLSWRYGRLAGDQRRLPHEIPCLIGTVRLRRQQHLDSVRTILDNFMHQQRYPLERGSELGHDLKTSHEDPSNLHVGPGIIPVNRRPPCQHIQRLQPLPNQLLPCRKKRRGQLPQLPCVDSRIATIFQPQGFQGGIPHLLQLLLPMDEVNAADSRESSNGLVQQQKYLGLREALTFPKIVQHKQLGHADVNILRKH